MNTDRTRQFANPALPWLSRASYLSPTGGATSHRMTLLVKKTTTAHGFVWEFVCAIQNTVNELMNTDRIQIMQINKSYFSAPPYYCLYWSFFSCQHYYCVVEYATPLLTLYQMSQDGSAGFSAWDRRQQVLLFYTSLSHILENSLECRNRYRLILLDGECYCYSPLFFQCPYFSWGQHFA